MKYLFKEWRVVAPRLAGKFVMLFLDYDGTLAPIAEEPGKTVFPKETKRLLGLLAKNPRCKVAIVSGRAVKDVKGLVGVGGIIYIGNHGLEVEGAREAFRARLHAGYKAALKGIKDALGRSLSAIGGILIEDKGPTVSVHYRLVGKGDLAALKRAFRKVVRPYLLRKDVRIISGKKVFEIRPPSAPDKGIAVQRLIDKEKKARRGTEITAIYAGDDTTDEDAFRRLRNSGLTVFIGRSRRASGAQYYVRDVKELAILLNRLEKAL